MKRMRKMLTIFCLLFVMLLPITTKAQNYFYSDSWNTLEFKDVNSSSNRVTYSTRYSARQAYCYVIVSIQVVLIHIKKQVSLAF